jgi:hypothetical protein
MSTSKAVWVPAALLMAMPIALAGAAPDAEQTTSTRAEVPRTAARTVEHPGATAADLVLSYAQVRMIGDLAALQTYRPGYAFWQHVFTIPDGAIAYGSAGDGRLLAVFPAKGDWTRNADWQEAALATLLRGQRLPSPLDDRRDLVARLMETDAGPVLHNPTRGGFLLPNVDRYAGFLSEWAAIYERFGVPGELGLAQAVVESGLRATGTG